MEWFEPRRRRENELLSECNVHVKSARALLRVDQAHGFFYDHPLDHVPGLLLIEAGMQLGLAWGLEYRPRAAPRRISVRFLRYCLHGAPIEARLSTKAAGKDVAMCVEFQQQGRLRARLVMDVAFGNAERQTDARLARALSRDGSIAAPAPKTPLNKVNPANVMITEPVYSADGMFCTLLDADAGNLLGDPDGAEFWHPLYLLESWMQAQRYANTTAQRPASRMRDILVGLDLDLLAPAPRSERIGLITEPENGPQKVRDRWLARTGVIGSSNEVHGRMSMLTARPVRAMAE